MVTQVVIPQFYETMQSGRIVKWLKKEGDAIQKGEPVVEIETDKTTVEIEASQDGSLSKILAQEGDEVSIFQPIALIADQHESQAPLGSSVQTAERAVPAEQPITKTEGLEKTIPPEVKQPSPTIVQVPISPAARRIARDHGIDLTKIKGSGPNGRIDKEDVMKAVAVQSSAPELKQANVLPMSQMRKTIAERMLHSATTIPQVTVTAEIDMSAAVGLREKSTSFQTEFSVNVSHTDILVKAVAMTLCKHPIFNSKLEGDEIRILDDVNIGIAVALDEGLIVPVIRNADKKPLIEIARSSKHLIQGAKEGKLSSSELSGGTFTISNLGGYGADMFTPLVNPPEIAILGIGKIAERPVVTDGHIAIRPTAVLSLSFDHRVVDGALAAQFLRSLKGIMESSNLEEMIRA